MSEPFQLEIEEGVVDRPDRIVVYGPQGIGKSTLASGAEKPFFLDLEGGTTKLNVARNKKPINTWVDFMRAVEFMGTANHPYKSLVIDTLDRAEWLCTKYLCETNKEKGRPSPVTNLALVGGGYGKGYEALYEEFRRLFEVLERRVWMRGMNVIILAHAKLENVKNPSGPDYQRHSLKVHEKVAAMFYEAADAVLFAYKEITVKKEGAFDEKRFRASSNNSPFLYTRDKPSHAAKNRYNLPERLPLAWDDLSQAMLRGRSPSILIDNIRTLAITMPLGPDGGADEEFAKKVDGAIDRINGDVEKLITLQGWVGSQITSKHEQIEKQLEAAAVLRAREENQQQQAAS